MSSSLSFTFKVYQCVCMLWLLLLAVKTLKGYTLMDGLDIYIQQFEKEKTRSQFYTFIV